MNITRIDENYFPSSYRPSIRPLQSVGQHAILLVLGNTNIGESDGIERNGGTFQARGCDPTPTQEAQADVHLCSAQERPEGPGSVCSTLTQSGKYDTRTVQGTSAKEDRSPDVSINVLSVALRPISSQPLNRNDYRRRSIESRHVYFATWENKRQDGQGRVESEDEE